MHYTRLIHVVLFFGSSGLAQVYAAGPVKYDPLSTRSVVVSTAAEGINGITANVSAGPLLFFPEVTYSSGGQIFQQTAIADVNGDGKPDLIVTNSCIDNTCTGGGDAGVFLGNGDGTFQPPLTYGSGGIYAGSFAVADINRDGKPDLVIANECSPGSNCVGDGNVAILLNNGNGTFQPAVTYDSGGTTADSVAVADVNGDGIPDLIVGNNNCFFANPCIASTVAILIGNPDGTFQAPKLYGSGGYSLSAVAVTDVNGDSIPDLLVVNDFGNQNTGPGSVGVLLGNGDGSFQGPQLYSPGFATPDGVTVADVNGDGKPDLVIVGSSNSVAVMLGNGDGTFQAPVLYDSGGNYAFSVVVADVNGDMKPDLVVPNGGSTWVSVLFGNGDGTFQMPVQYDSGAYSVDSVAVADVNGDNKPDVVVANACTTTGSSCSSTSIGILAVLLNNMGTEPTTTSLVPSVDPVNAKQIVTYKATVTNGSGLALNGTVMFKDGDIRLATVPLISNQAAFTTSYMTAGTHSITAAYSGDFGRTEGSRSTTLTEYVRNTPSKTVLTTSESPSFFGKPVTFTATVTSTKGSIPDGELVIFYDGKTTLGSAALMSSVGRLTTAALSAGTHTIKATYVGDNVYKPSSGTVQQVVKKYPTTTTLVSKPNPSSYGQPVIFTATVRSAGPVPTGRVKFLDGTLSIGSATLSRGVAILTKSTLAIGTHPITAQYTGDAASAPSASTVVNQIVH